MAEDFRVEVVRVLLVEPLVLPLLADEESDLAEDFDLYDEEARERLVVAEAEDLLDVSLLADEAPDLSLPVDEALVLSLLADEVSVLLLLAVDLSLLALDLPLFDAVDVPLLAVDLPLLTVRVFDRPLLAEDLLDRPDS